MKQGGRVVWSTGGPRPCARCGRHPCTCADARRVAAGTKAVTVGRETKGRRGKGVTVVKGLALRGAALEDLMRDLKRLCASGGTVRGDALEIQGDHRDLIGAELERRGLRVRRAGG